MNYEPLNMAARSGPVGVRKDWQSGAANVIRWSLSLSNELWHTPALLHAGLVILPYAGVLMGLNVAAHYGAVTEAPLPVQFFLASDEGFGEWLEYALTFTIGAMLCLLWMRERHWAYLANAALFFWLTLDNKLQLHEIAGKWLGPWLEGRLPIPVEANHIGESLLFLAVGLVWGFGPWLSVRAAQFRPAFYSLLLAGCVAATAFFGVFVDLLVVWGERDPVQLGIVTFIEDGGEFSMILLTVFVMIAIWTPAITGFDGGLLSL